MMKSSGSNYDEKSWRSCCCNLQLNNFRNYLSKFTHLLCKCKESDSLSSFKRLLQNLIYCNESSSLLFVNRNFASLFELQAERERNVKNSSDDISLQVYLEYFFSELIGKLCQREEISIRKKFSNNLDSNNSAEKRSEKNSKHFAISQSEGFCSEEEKEDNLSQNYQTVLLAKKNRAQTTFAP